MTLRSQLTWGLVLLLLLTTGLAVYQLVLTRELHEANRQLAGVDLELSRASLRLRRHVDRLADLTRRYAVLRADGYVEELGRVRLEVHDEIAHLESLPLADMGPIAALRRHWMAYEAAAGHLEAAIDAGHDAEADLAAVLETLDQPRELARRLDSTATARAAEVIEASAARSAAAARATLIVAVLGLALAGGLAYWLGHSTAAPLRALTRGAEAMAAGDFEQRVPVTGPSEVASLAQRFNAMGQKLGELDRMKRDFLSSVSHDLKAPLASIQETTRLLLESDPGLAPDKRRLLELSGQSAQRLETMIADLLDIARLEAGAVIFQLDVLDLNDCCREAVDRAAALLEHKGIEVDARLAPDALPIRADAPLLVQAFANLLSNAVKYSPPRERLELATRAVEAEGGAPAVRLRLRDRGPGVPDADKERIFDRFYTSEAGALRPAGTGLGLAIARSIVIQHGGRIWVEDAAGGGSVFYVELPAAHPSQTAATGVGSA